MMTSGQTKEDAMRTLYQDVLLDHHQDPRNFGELPQANVTQEGFNPLCGDRVCLQLKWAEGGHDKVEAIRFKGEGCAICMASTSMMTEELTGKSREDALSKIQNFRDWMQGREHTEFEAGDIAALSGVRSFPVRIKCALLPWTTLKEAISSNEGKKD